MTYYKQLCETHAKLLNVISEGLSSITVSDEHEQAFITNAQQAIQNLLDNVPNIEREFNELYTKFDQEKCAKNSAYFFILESGLLYKYKKWFYSGKKSDIQTTLETIWENNMRPSKPSKRKKY